MVLFVAALIAVAANSPYVLLAGCVLQGCLLVGEYEGHRD